MDVGLLGSVGMHPCQCRRSPNALALAVLKVQRLCCVDTWSLGCARGQRNSMLTVTTHKVSSVGWFIKQGIGLARTYLKKVNRCIWTEAVNQLKTKSPSPQVKWRAQQRKAANLFWQQLEPKVKVPRRQNERFRHGKTNMEWMSYAIHTLRVVFYDISFLL